MTLKLYNTRTRTKEEFRPLDPDNVRMYVCGPTVYDYAHIGNARPVIVFDVLYRLLRHIYGAEHVTYVRNITDVDDKINARAAEEGIPIRELTDRTLKQFQADVAALGCLPPNVEPRATDHIEEMKAMIETLVAKGCAYVAEEHVLFHVAAMPDYGQLSRRSLDEMQAGARVEVAPYKRDPMDFVLWKPSKNGEPGWPAPCGIEMPGRPGWHIECSAMSEKHLGKTFDIHGGGIDLMFPHHENEVAQSRCANDTKIMANVWMHNGFLQVEGQKMSKSLGNFLTINELLRYWPGEVLRIAMLMTHYRDPVDWTRQRCLEAKEFLDKCKRALIGNEITYSNDIDQNTIKALSNDLNSPGMFRSLHGLIAKSLNGENKSKQLLYSTLKLIGIDILVPAAYSLEIEGLGAEWNKARANAEKRGVFIGRPMASTDLEMVELVRDYMAIGASALTKGDVVWLSNNLPAIELKNKIDARLVARRAKDWAEADRIRDELTAMGIALKDAKDPKTGEIVTTWEIAR